MKNKVFCWVIGCALLMTCATGCELLPFPNGDSGQNSADSNENNNNNNDNNDQTNDYNRLVNNSFSKVQHYLFQPIMSLDGAINYNFLSSGKTITYGFENGNKVALSNKGYNETFKRGITIYGNVDNIAYNKVTNHVSPDSIPNNSNFVHSSLYDAKDSSFDLVDYHADKVHRNSNGLFYKTKSGAYEAVEYASFDMQLAKYLEMAYFISNVKFDYTKINVASIAWLLEARENIPYPGETTQNVTTIDAIFKTIDFIHGKITQKDFLSYLCTRVFLIDVNTIDSNTLAYINSFLLYVRTIDIDSLFKYEKFDGPEGKIITTLDYRKFLTIYDDLISNISSLANYTDPESSLKISQIVTKLNEIKGKLPVEVNFAKTLNTKKDSYISSLDMHLDIEGGNIVRHSYTYTDDRDPTYTQRLEETVADNMVINFSTNVSFFDSYLDINPYL